MTANGTVTEVGSGELGRHVLYILTTSCGASYLLCMYVESVEGTAMGENTHHMQTLCVCTHTYV